MHTRFSVPFSSPATTRRSGLLALCCVASLAAGCSPSTAVAPQAQVAEVAVFVVAPQALHRRTELPGRTSAFQVAEVRPQVGGLIQQRLFVEGADVKAGSALYQIDPASYQAAYNSAKAALSKAKANLLTSGPKVARYKDLVAIEGVSRQEYDDAVAANEQALADVESASAALEAAAINLRYTHVDAPISGRIGRSSVTPGALVTASQAAALTTVQQLDPIYVDVTQSSEDLLRLKREMDSGTLKQAGGQAGVTLLLADGSKYAGTGNVTLRALFPNPKHDLLPGMFVRAVIDSGVNEHAIAVPQQGITRNPKGEATALLLNRDGKVEQRSVVTGGTLGDQWLVTAGLVAGDRVIVEGLQKVKPGAPALVAKTSSVGDAAIAGGGQPANANSAH